MAHDRRTIVSIGSDPYKTDIRTTTGDGSTSHTWHADEPKSMGGQDTGPTPYDLLLSALGACKVITVRMYADRKGWPLEAVTIALRHDHRHPEDCQDCDSPAAKLDHIDVDLQFHGDLTDDQRTRLAEIADKCPVHKTLHSELRVVSTLITDDSASTPE
jgi:uncharacterized OsmC-like protein